MKLTILGFWGGYPAADGATSAYLLEEKNFKLLLDAGSGSLAKLQKYINLKDLNAVILSHHHHDHIADIGVLQYAKLVQSYTTDCRRTLPIYSHNEDKERFDALSHDYTEGVVYNPNAPLHIGPFSITFMKTFHPVPCYGMRITNGEGTLVYTADTAYKKEWEAFAANADVLITDCNFYADQDGTKAGHMTSKEGAIIAEHANVKQLILSHLPQYGDHSRLIQEAKQYYNGPVQLAKEGLTWEFKSGEQ
ncbi:MBL fold metallo-hydrolase [Virgibacillus alimentarius]|uniref:MBL fold metallo-hydrolase n=1 Tax=Virgibacillus alimentarius TaxID=698769 RepID=UPI000493A9ED|nr:MBL fold metallo-hydrolase [Virgibacillus alimentarius]